jgi:hypothetical protein
MLTHRGEFIRTPSNGQDRYHPHNRYNRDNFPRNPIFPHLTARRVFLTIPLQLGGLSEAAFLMFSLSVYLHGRRPVGRVTRRPAPALDVEKNPMAEKYLKGLAAVALVLSALAVTAAATYVGPDDSAGGIAMDDSGPAVLQAGTDETPDDGGGQAPTPGEGQSEGPAAGDQAGDAPAEAPAE